MPWLVPLLFLSTGKGWVWGFYELARGLKARTLTLGLKQWLQVK